MPVVLVRMVAGQLPVVVGQEALVATVALPVPEPVVLVKPQT
jgi:hypothetical protein